MKDAVYNPITKSWDVVVGGRVVKRNVKAKDVEFWAALYRAQQSTSKVAKP